MRQGGGGGKRGEKEKKKKKKGGGGGGGGENEEKNESITGDVSEEMTTGINGHFGREQARVSGISELADVCVPVG